MLPQTKECPWPAEAGRDEKAFSLRAFRKRVACQNLDFRLPASRTEKECISVI